MMMTDDRVAGLCSRHTVLFIVVLGCTLERLLAKSLLKSQHFSRESTLKKRCHVASAAAAQAPGLLCPLSSTGRRVALGGDPQYRRAAWVCGGLYGPGVCECTRQCLHNREGQHISQNALTLFVKWHVTGCTNVSAAEKNFTASRWGSQCHVCFSGEGTYHFHRWPAVFPLWKVPGGLHQEGPAGAPGSSGSLGGSGRQGGRPPSGSLSPDGGTC